MKRVLIPAVLLSFLLILSCTPGGSGFIDQPLQGKIEGASWTYVSGIADTTMFSGEIWIELYDVAATGLDPFAMGAYPNNVDYVLFSVPEGTGLYSLGLFTQTVTLYCYASSTNTICVDGAVEIQSIDTIGGTLTGRINARSDSGTYVNGNFTVYYQ